jgi:hypothetical protein
MFHIGDYANGAGQVSAGWPLSPRPCPPDGAAGPTARKAPSQSRSGSRSPACASAMMRCATAARMGSWSGGGAERGQRHLKGDPHLTGRFAVELMTTVEVRSDGHGKRLKRLKRLKFHVAQTFGS